MSWMKISAAAGAAIMLAVCTVPALADQPAPEATAKAQTTANTDAAAKSKADKAEAKKLAKREAELKKVVCRTEPVLGSRIPKRTCRTRADWIQMQKNSRDQTQGIQNDNSHWNRVEGKTGGG